MNKETIVKYQEEFIAWCKGKSILKGAPISMGNRELHWEEVKDFTDWQALDTVYILNDSYSIYRKAMAEGKTVQYKMGIHLDTKEPVWHDITPDSYNKCTLDWWETKSGNIKGFENYRIKPDEPKFKIGDWVKYVSSSSNDYCNGEILQITKIDTRGFCTFGEYSKLYHIDSIKLWKPQQDEWCLFYTANPTHAVLAQFVEMQFINNSCGEFYKASTGSSFKHCIPYLGHLLEELVNNQQKDKKLELEKV